MVVFPGAGCAARLGLGVAAVVARAVVVEAAVFAVLAAGIQVELIH
jgi:hypothetical protein